MSKKKVILTIPHVECKNGVGYCDPNVLNHAKNLKKQLDLHKIPNKLIVGDINRKDVDLNRKKSENTKFSKKIDKELQKDVILLDIHSFQDIHQSSLVYLTMDNKLNDFAERTNGKILNASEKNYIINKSIKKGKKAILIEFNDTKKQTLNYKKIAKSLKQEL